MIPRAIKSNQFDLFIGGSLSPSKSGKYFDSIDPSNGEVFCQIADASTEDMRQAISAARKAFDSGVWSGMPLPERGSYLKKIADLIREHAKELAEFESQDTGKTSKQATFIDVPTCADTFEYFGSLAHELDDEVNPVTAPVKSVTRREPMGVVGCLIPWNYPLIMSAWKIAPALIAGNTVVFRPSAVASASVMKLAQLIADCVLPDGVINFVPAKDHSVAQELIQSDKVDMITFTGGTKTGSQVMCLAAATTKKLTLELGGKSPNIVFADCDFEAAIGGTMSAIFMNQGQMCTAGSRLLIEASIYDKFLDELVSKTKELKVGSAADYSTDFGPLVSEKQLKSVAEYVEVGKKEGAQLACGGSALKIEGFEKGFYFEPTIFADVTNDMRIAREEIFGPILSVIKFWTLEEAIKIANDSDFGLASCVWTKDTNKADLVAKQLLAGTVWVNTYGGFYNQAPIGGFKRSGFGRELGRDGVLEYTQTKHICVDATPGGKSLVTSWF